MLYDNFPTSEFSKSRPKPKDIEASWMSLLLVNYWVLSPGVEPSHTSIQHGRVLQSLIQSIQIWPLSAILKYFIKNDSRGKLCVNEPRSWCQLLPSTLLQSALDPYWPELAGNRTKFHIDFVYIIFPFLAHCDLNTCRCFSLVSEKWKSSLKFFRQIGIFILNLMSEISRSNPLINKYY